MGNNGGENSEEGFDDVTGRLSLGREAVEGGASGAEVSDGSERELLVFELLRHCADDDAEAVVVVLRGGAESSED